MPNDDEDKQHGGSSSGSTRVGKYILLETLGEGAFGKVKLAIDSKTGREYAIKVMEKSHIEKNELTLQVRREIAVMKAMRHREFIFHFSFYPLSNICFLYVRIWAIDHVYVNCRMKN